MQKLLLVCVFAFALCLTAHAKPTTDDAGKTAKADEKEHASTKVTEKPSPVVTDPAQTVTTTSSPNKTSDSNATDKGKNTVDPTKVITPTIPTTKSGASEPVTMPAVPTKSTPVVPNPTIPSKDAVTTNATTVAPATVTPASAATKTPVPTTERAKLTTSAPILVARGFDGGSFIGGIVLALGLLGVGFVGFKYYKTRTERNYHTL